MSFRPSLYPTIATALGLVLLVSLGTWQCRQFQRKRAIERQKQSRAGGPVVDVRDVEQFRSMNLGHRRLRLHGTLLSDTRIVFENRFNDGDPGVWLASPLRLQKDGFILVNRGWIPFQEAKGQLPESIKTPDTEPESTYLGVAQPIERPVRDAFMRKQIAQGETTVWKNETRWESVDIPTLTTALEPHIQGASPPGHFLVALDQRHSGDPFPITGRDQKVQKYLTAGRHLGYSVFWFMVAAALLGMYIASGFGVLGSFERGQRKA